MNAYDRAQDLNMAEIESVQQRARLPDAGPAPAARDCNGCGRPIDRRRLKAWPTAICCVPCAEAGERRAAQFRRRRG